MQVKSEFMADFIMLVPVQQQSLSPNLGLSKKFLRTTPETRTRGNRRPAADEGATE